MKKFLLGAIFGVACCLAIKAYAEPIYCNGTLTTSDCEVELPIKAEVIRCVSHEEALEQCYNGYDVCCVIAENIVAGLANEFNDFEPAGGDNE